MTTTALRQETLPSSAAPALRSRRSRRRLLLVWSAPVALVAVALAARMIGMTIVNDRGVDAFNRGGYGSSPTGFELLQTANVLQRWVAPFNHGDSLFRQKKYRQAESQFRSALDLAPAGRSCMVRVNLVLTVESIGDAQVVAKSLPGAIVAYQRAVGTADAGHCPLGARQHTGERLAQARAEIAAKLAALGAKPPAKPDNTTSKQQQQTPPPSPDSNQKTKLQQENDNAQRDNQKERDHYDPNSDGLPNDKNW
jgi:hypothetical protein